MAKIKGIELNLYEKTLENGLKIYVIPKNDIDDIFVTFTTMYGSIHNDFIPIGKDDIYTVPAGIAHFLEHKVFEQEDGSDVFEFFEKNGAGCNANTWYYRTTYLFNATSRLTENLNFLLDYVQSPYFTDENVLKEKGIIEQEARMYLDDPMDRFFEASKSNAFKNDPIGIPVIGTLDSINSITKDDLYTCYNTFYHPSNMFVFVTGNVNPNEVFDIVSKNQNKKAYPKPNKITLKKYTEPDKVKKEFEVIKMDITVPKISYNFKIKIPYIEGIQKKTILEYINMFFTLKFGPTSSFNEEMRLREISKTNISTFSVESTDYVLHTVATETTKTTEFIEEVKNELETLFVREEDFNRIKKVILSIILRMSENIVGLNYYFLENIVKYGEIDINDYDDILNMDYKTFTKIIKSINFDNHNIVIIEPK